MPFPAKLTILPFLSKKFKISKTMMVFGFKYENEFSEIYGSGGNEFQ